MTLNPQEYEAIIGDDSKVITEDIRWERPANSSIRKFRAEISSGAGYPIFVDGWFNSRAGKLSYSIIHRTLGDRIYGLDLGAEHQNPDGENVGEKHKNYWVPGCRDKWAYEPEDITETWDHPVEVWGQFCTEANLRHSGTMQPPQV